MEIQGRIDRGLLLLSVERRGCTRALATSVRLHAKPKPTVRDARAARLGAGE